MFEVCVVFSKATHICFAPFSNFPLNTTVPTSVNDDLSSVSQDISHVFSLMSPVLWQFSTHKTLKQGRDTQPVSFSDWRLKVLTNELFHGHGATCVALSIDIVTGAHQADCCLQAICGYYVSIKGKLQGNAHANSNTLCESTEKCVSCLLHLALISLGIFPGWWTHHTSGWRGI